MINNHNFPNCISDCLKPEVAPQTKNFSALFLLFLLLGCNPPDSIKPGDGFTQHTLTVKVDPRDHYPDTTHNRWKSSRLSANASHTMNLYVTGDIFTCSETVTGSSSTDNLKYPIQKKQVVVHSALCTDGRAPNYPTEDVLQNYDTPFPWNTICPGGTLKPTLDYLDSGIKISSGDMIDFKLVPSTKTITSCNSIPNGIVFDDDLRKNDNKGSPEDDSKHVIGSGIATTQEVCEGGKFWKNINGTFEPIELPRFAGQTFSRIVSNDSSPLGNKVFHNRNELYWNMGAFKDLRYFEPKETKDDRQRALELVNCGSAGHPITAIDRAKNAKFDTTKLNEQCKAFWRQGGAGRILSYTNIRPPILTSIEDIKEAAEFLIAKIGGSPTYGSSGDLCFPNNLPKTNCANVGSANFDQVALRLNHPQRLPIPDKPEDRIDMKPVYLLIYDSPGNYFDNLGGYNVEIEHTCPRHDGEELYGYIGDINGASPPQPGDPGTFLIGDRSNHQYIYEINGSGGNAPRSGPIWFMINNLNPNKDEAIGEYEVVVTYNEIKPIISTALEAILGPFKKMLRGDPTNNETFGGVTREFYRGILANGNFRRGIQLLLVLYVSFIGIKFLFALGDIKLQEVVQIILKFGLVLTLLSDGSWEFFTKYFFGIFWDGGHELIAKFGGWYEQHDSKYDSSFTFLDKTLGMLFSVPNIVRVLSLVVSSIWNPLAMFAATTIVYGVIEIAAACLNGILMYLVSLVIVSFLIALAPLFICFVLFKQTFKLFNGWVKQLLVTMMTPILYFALIGFLNEMLFYSMYQVFNFGVNAECLLKVSFGFDVCVFWFPIPNAGSSSYGSFSQNAVTGSNGDIVGIMPVSIMHLIIFKIITKAYAVVTNICAIMPTALFSGSYMFSSEGIKQIASEMSEGLKYPIGMDQASVRRRKENRTKPKPRGGVPDKTPPKIEVKVKPSHVPTRD